MSTPDTLYVSYDGNGFKKLFLGKRAAGDLFNYLLPRLDTAAPDFKDQFEGEYYGEVLSLVGLPGRYFCAVYQLIMTACDELQSLTPYKAELQSALQSDQRYNFKPVN